MFGKTVQEIKGTKPKGKRKQETSDFDYSARDIDSVLNHGAV